MVENHPFTLQKKLLAVHHWKVLAAELVSKLHSLGGFAGKTLYVDASATRPGSLRLSASSSFRP
jgi:hypothetical protein